MQRQKQLQRLAERIAAGEVVFFIGAGFSLDSEKNATPILMARLLARFEAIIQWMRTRPPYARAAARLWSSLLAQFFGWERPAPASLFDARLKERLSELGREYYLINDWMCSAFEEILDAFADDPGPLNEFHTVNAEENKLLKQAFEPHYNDSVLLPLDLPWFCNLHTAASRGQQRKAERAVAGKALFLETVGFCNEGVMGGDPMNAQLERVLECASPLLRPRHAALARLASEGLCPALVTTNYDLLVDAAYRLSGLRLNDADCNSQIPSNRRYRNFQRVRSATEFFRRGDSHHAAMIHKIHGCVDAYREARLGNDPELFRNVLPTLVYTFREIQNWREDSWSRDYLSTLLRTRTVVFAGYSAADPVIHDTFRSVYEEMAAYKGRLPASAGAVSEQPGESAPAFFFDLNQQFYSLEILRAASLAAGDSSVEFGDHPNLITFCRLTTGGFPHFDELFDWLFHLTFRKLQDQVLESELRRLICQLTGTPRPEKEIEGAMSHFRELCASETVLGESLGVGEMPADEARRKLRRMTSWTTNFHVSLLREYALAENLLRNPGAGFEIQRIVKFPWYAPIGEHPQWGAWGAILEVAIRRAAAVIFGDADAWKLNTPKLEAALAGTPSIAFQAAPSLEKCDVFSVRRSLSIQAATMNRFFRSEPVQRHLMALPPLVWDFRGESIPWPRAATGAVPSARHIWTWASLPQAQWPADCAPQIYFGGPATAARNAA